MKRTDNRAQHQTHGKASTDETLYKAKFVGVGKDDIKTQDPMIAVRKLSLKSTKGLNYTLGI